MTSSVRIVGGYLRKTGDLGVLHVLQRFVRVAWFVLLHPRLGFSLFSALRNPALSKLIRRDPSVLLKFVWRIYARGLSIADRAAMIADHYNCLASVLSRDFLERIVDTPAPLWELPVEGGSLQVALDTGPLEHFEGELTLHFLVNGARVFVLHFVIAPGGIVGPDIGRAMYVTGLQGTRGCAELVKFATRTACDVAPPLLLMATLEGMAMSLGIRHILGISAADQVCSAEETLAVDFVPAYDEFWRSIEGRQLPSGWFHFPVPLPVKPLQFIKLNHRARVKARRAFRGAVADLTRAQVRQARRGLDMPVSGTPDPA